MIRYTSHFYRGTRAILGVIFIDIDRRYVCETWVDRWVGTVSFFLRSTYRHNVTCATDFLYRWHCAEVLVAVSITNGDVKIDMDNSRQVILPDDLITTERVSAPSTARNFSRIPPDKNDTCVDDEISRAEAMIATLAITVGPGQRTRHRSASHAIRYV